MTESTDTAVPERPKARERGRLRRRLRRQRQMREALLLDLGAIVYELHRQGRREPELLQAKAAELKAIDQEVRALARALDSDEGMMQLSAAGIAGSCENCGSLLSTDARYCGACGAAVVPALAGSSPAPRAGEVPRSDGPALETGEHEALSDDLLEEPPAEDEPVEDEPAEELVEDTAEDEPAPDEPAVEEEPLEEEPVEEEPVEEEPVQEEPVEQDTVEDEPVADEPTPERSKVEAVLEAPWLRSRQDG